MKTGPVGLDRTGNQRSEMDYMVCLFRIQLMNTFCTDTRRTDTARTIIRSITALFTDRDRVIKMDTAAKAAPRTDNITAAEKKHAEEASQHVEANCMFCFVEDVGI